MAVKASVAISHEGVGRNMIRSLCALAAVLVVACYPVISEARQHRSHSAIARFKRLNPCPSTGKSRGACPGYTIDHRIALCVGGRDESENMQWMTNESSWAKDKWECKPGWETKLMECERSGCS